jgi:DNA polymerase III alpha subunit
MTPDVIIKNEDKCNRVLELGQTVLSGVEHGWCGRFIEIYELSKKNNLKPLYGTEAYFVTNRLEKDRTNAHLMIIAKNDVGRKAINLALSDANMTGYYYKPRVDLDLVLSLPKNDIWLTSACLGGIWKYENHIDIFEQIIAHFGNNFFFEVQNHPVDKQKELNKHILELAQYFNSPIIAGMDTHVIHHSQKNDRDEYLRSRGVVYEDEQGWNIDFPDCETAFNRFVEQGVLSNSEIELAMNNTNIFEEVSKYDSPIFTKEIKLPSIHKDKTQDEKNEIFTNLIWEKWDEEKNNVPSKKWKQYEKEIQKEVDVVVKTGMADYFLLDYEIVKRGIEMGGMITLTGRGSAPSYFICKLLGFTTIDRISAEVKLFPERFISAERLIEAKSLPDIDFNVANPEVFANAQEEIMGIGKSYKMIAFGKVKELSAWKMYARQAGVDFDLANEVSSQIQQFEEDSKYAEDEEKYELDIHNYIDKKYHKYIDESKKFLKLVNDVKPHPCGYATCDFDIREEFGIIRLKSGTNENICACVDGKWLEDYKMLKNDWLKVQVVELIHKTFQKIGIEPYPIPKLIEICNKDEKVWKTYSDGITISVNQFEKESTSKKAMRYAPKNISEITAFVAGIRPGAKSIYHNFESRTPFDYGVNSIDTLIQTEEFPYSYMLYQENAMAVMAWAGIPMYQTYEIVKAIAKKRYDDVLKHKEIFINGMMKRLTKTEGLDKEHSTEIAKNTWKIIEDSSQYSFNCSHAYAVAGDSLYCSWLKENYAKAFYEVFMQIMEADGSKDRIDLAKQEAIRFFGINFPNPQFGQDNTKIVGNPEKNEITQSLTFYKGFGEEIGKILFQLSKDFTGGTFLDLLFYAEKGGFLSQKWENLIEIGYFNQFGPNKKLLLMWKEFRTGKSKFNSKLTEKTQIKRIEELMNIWNNLPEEKLSVMEQIAAEVKVLGRIQSVFPDLSRRFRFVNSVDTKYSPKLNVHCLTTGTQMDLKINKDLFERNPIQPNTIIYVDEFKEKNAKKCVIDEITGKKSFPDDLSKPKVWWIERFSYRDIQ